MIWLSLFCSVQNFREALRARQSFWAARAQLDTREDIPFCVCVCAYALRDFIHKTSSTYLCARCVRRAIFHVSCTARAHTNKHSHAVVSKSITRPTYLTRACAHDSQPRETCTGNESAWKCVHAKIGRNAHLHTKRGTSRSVV